jgi:methyl-accepting chemotaxis protein
MGFKDLKIGLKVVSIMGTCIVLTLIITVSLLNQNLSDIKKRTLEQKSSSFSNEIRDNLEAKKDVWLTNALQIANNLIVQKAMIENDRQTLISALGDYGELFKKHTGFKNVDIHIIDQDLRSFVKSWSPDKFGEPLDYSSAYKKVKQSGLPLAVLEPSPKGMRLKGLFPIMNGSEFRGIVNFEGGLNSIKRTFKTHDIEFLYFLGNDYLSTAKDFKDREKLGGFTLSQKDVDKSFLSYAKEALNLEQAIRQYCFDDKYLTIALEAKGLSGKTVGLFLVGQKSSLVMDDVAKNTKLVWTVFAIMLSSIILMLVIITLFINRSILKPIKVNVDFAQKISNGDLTATVNINRKDELGKLAVALNSMAANLRGMFKNIVGGVETLTSSSTKLSVISQQIAAGSEQSSGKAQTVSAATEGMNSNMQAVASASEQTSTNVQLVATAAEQMTATIAEIAGNTENGCRVASEAVDQAKVTAHQVSDLGKAVQLIGKVTEAIADISDQTNLLALNATIEAARAGEAGKGFAVVASEIKELAKQTADATKEIGGQISDIQNKTGDTVSKIDQISSVIHDLSELVNTVASAMEEQSAATEEIASNVHQAAQSIDEVNKNVLESTKVSGGIAQDMTEVNQAVQEIASGSSQVSSSAQGLSGLAEKLNQMMSRFKISM